MRNRGKRAAAIAVDAVLAALAPVLTRGHRSAIVPKAPRVLVVRCDHIGDAAMATAVLGPLRDALRPDRLDVLAGPWAAPIFEGHLSVNHVITYATPWWSAARGAPVRERLRRWAELPGVIREIRAARYDVGIDLRGDLRQITCFLALGGMPIRVGTDRTGGARLLTHVWPHDPALHEVEKNLAIGALLGATGPPRLDVAARADLPAWFRAMLLADADARGYMVFALRGSEPNRAWPTALAAHVADVARRELGLVSVYVGAQSDALAGDELARLASSKVINIAGRTTLDEAIAVLGAAAVTVAVDSGPMHLAAATGAPVVALFGSGDPNESRPWSEAAQIVTVGAPCGCLHPRCDFTEGPGRCMRAITPDAVLDAVRRAVALGDDENVLRERAPSRLVDGQTEHHE